MNRQLRAKHDLWGRALLAAVFLYAPQVGADSEPSPRVGTLHIEGERIERLVLQDSAGQRTVFYYREPDLVLPEGTYRLEEVVLQGDYSSLGPRIPVEAQMVRIEPDRLVTLRLGAPLRQTIQVQRWGASLVLSYQLLGQGGESYAVTQRQAVKPPAFIIYRGEKNIASGSFVPG